jgi:hypothetical protein
MTLDLDLDRDFSVDPQLEALLRRTLESVADQTPLSSEVPLLAGVTPLAETRSRARWARPALVAAASVAAAAVAVSVLAGGGAADGPVDVTATVASEPAPSTTVAVPAGEVVDLGPRVEAWRDLVRDALQAGGLRGGEAGHPLWIAVPPELTRFTAYQATTGGPDDVMVASVELRMFEPGEFRDDPAWAQQVAGAPDAGEPVAEGRLFLVPDASGTVRTAIVVGERGMATVRAQGEAAPTADQLLTVARRVAAGSIGIDAPKG